VTRKTYHMFTELPSASFGHVIPASKGGPTSW
jgi:hypothetical protein